MAKQLFTEDEIKFGTGIHVINQNSKLSECKYYINFLVNIEDDQSEYKDDICLMFTENEVKDFFNYPFVEEINPDRKNIIQYYSDEIGVLKTMRFAGRPGYIGKLTFESATRCIFLPKYLFERGLLRAKRNLEDVTSESTLSQILRKIF